MINAERFRPEHSKNSNKNMPTLALFATTTYTAVGLYLTIFGRFKEVIQKEIESITSGHQDKQKSLFNTRIRTAIGTAIIILFCTAFWPVFIWSLTSKNGKNNSHASKPLSFNSINGYGPVTCKVCGHTENITAFTHGVKEHEEGAQCQTCGTFHTIPHNSDKCKCECGGMLSRERPIFCPTCKSRHMTYFADYLS